MFRILKIAYTFILLALSYLSLYSQCELNSLTNKSQFDVGLQQLIIEDIPVSIDIPEHLKSEEIFVIVEGKETAISKSKDGIYVFVFEKTGNYTFVVGKNKVTKNVRVLPLWYSIIPPLVAIIFAMLFKEVLTALLLGLLFGAVAVAYYSGDGSVFIAFIHGFFNIIDTRVIKTIADEGHASVIVFSLMIGAVVQIITKNGGMNGLVMRLARKVQTRRKGMFLTWLLGVAIFFDDYANTLVVGNTVRPITDRLKISRAKLAYIVDSTAAPVACLAFVTTWIGVELSYIQEGLNIIATDVSPYQLFLMSLPYRFYPFLALIFILFLIYQNKDFGSMLKSERLSLQVGSTNFEKSEQTHKSDENQAKESHWINALIPVLIIVFGTFAGLILTGYDSEVWGSDDFGFMRKLSSTIGKSDAFKALLWSSMLAVLVATIMSVWQKLLTLRQSSDAIVDGFRSMLTAIVILILAWSLASLTAEMHTAVFLAQMLESLKTVPGLLPAITFILGAVVAFSTGSSWGTMAILYPLLMPVTWSISNMAGYDNIESTQLLAQVIAGILAGAVLGDHCSPISDTTILSSLASKCDHIEHVQTQMPYAITVGLVALVIGLLPLIWNISPFLTYPVALVLLYFIIKYKGQKL